MVLTPKFLPDFGVTLDYWNIKLADAISAVSGGDTADHCVDATTGIGNIYCANAKRDPVTHELVFIRSVNQNISALSTSGVDIGTYYSHPLLGGKMRWDLNATKVIAFTEHPFQDDPSDTVQDNGTLGDLEGVTIRATYTVNSRLFNWNARYFTSMFRVSNESYQSNPTQTTPIRAGAGFFNDVRAGYSFKNGLQAYVGITNLIHSNPPVNLEQVSSVVRCMTPWVVATTRALTISFRQANKLAGARGGRIAGLFARRVACHATSTEGQGSTPFS